MAPKPQGERGAKVQQDYRMLVLWRSTKAVKSIQKKFSVTCEERLNQGWYGEWLWLETADYTEPQSKSSTAEEKKSLFIQRNPGIQPASCKLGQEGNNTWNRRSEMLQRLIQLLIVVLQKNNLTAIVSVADYIRRNQNTSCAKYEGFDCGCSCLH